MDRVFKFRSSEDMTALREYVDEQDRSEFRSTIYEGFWSKCHDAYKEGKSCVVIKTTRGCPDSIVFK